MKKQTMSFVLLEQKMEKTMNDFNYEIAEKIALRILANWGKDELDLWRNENNNDIYSTDNELDFNTYLESVNYRLISENVPSILDDWGLGKNPPSLNDLTELVYNHCEYFGVPENYNFPKGENKND